MAHSDWVNQSSRVVNAKAEVYAYNVTSTESASGINLTYGGKGSGGYHKFQVYFNNANYVKPIRYVQISGNRHKNQYPVDFQITGADGTDIYIKNNNSIDCIIDFKNQAVPAYFEITVHKWWGESNGIDGWSITNVSINVKFDLIECGMLKSFELENALPYDGTGDLKYGIKTSENTLEIVKDNQNTSDVYLKKTIDLSDVNMLNGFYDSNGRYRVLTSTTSPSGTSTRYWGSGFVEYGQTSGKPMKLYKGHKYLIMLSCKMTFQNKNTLEYLIDKKLRLTTSVGVEKSLQYPYGDGNGLSTMNGYEIVGEDIFPSREELFISQFNRVSYIYECKDSNYSDDIGEYTYRKVNFSMAAEGSVEDPKYESGKTEYIFDMQIRDATFFDLTDVFGQGNEPDIQWCDKHISVLTDGGYSNSTTTVYMDKNTSGTVLVPSSMSVLSRSEMCTTLENEPYINFSMELDNEFRYTLIGCYYIDSYDYDENKPTFDIVIKDNTKKMQERIYSGKVIDYGDGRYLATLFSAFRNQIVTPYCDIQIELNESFGNTYNVKHAIIPKNISIMDVCNKFCDVGQAYITPSLKLPYDNIKTMYWNCINKIKSNSYHISTNRCTNINIYNKNINSIKNVALSAYYKSSEQAVEQSKIAETPVLSTWFNGYVNTELPLGGMSEIAVNDTPSYSNGADILMSLGEYSNYQNMRVFRNQVTGYFDVSKSDVEKYDNFGVRFVGVRAKYTYVVDFAFGLTESSGIPSGENYSIKDYIIVHNGEQDTTQDISKLTDSDFSNVEWAEVKDFKNYTSPDDNSKIRFEYLIRYNANNDCLKYSSTSYPALLAALSRHGQAEILGAYKIYLYGYDSSSDYINYEYSIGSGNSFEIYNNEFLQNNCEDVSTGKSVQDSISDNIFAKFGNGVKTAEIEWVGSPYINLFDLVTLDNGITYRVHYIKHKYDGGYRQVLRLVEYKQ